MNFKPVIAGLVGLFSGFFSTFTVSAKNTVSAEISISLDKPAHQISPTLFGIFFEDINLSTDGGLYPELVRNRSFEDADTPENWKFAGSNASTTATIINADVQAVPPVPPLNAFNRKFLALDTEGEFKLENFGFWGMNVVKGEAYRFKVAARILNDFNSTLTVRLIGSDGKVLASDEITDFTSTWTYYTLTLTPLASDPQAHLQLSGYGTGSLYLDMVSLMPVKTWKNHGLRTDLAEAINALHPTFFRFPGGCWVEGDDFAHMNNWKKTIGNIDTRTPLWNIWKYNATNGLGYHEYLQLAEDLGAEPLYCINAGISHKEVVPMDQMGQWVQDALDAIEYANGPVTSVWGSIRAKNGHPAPFNLKYLEIGNENGQAPYAERWKLMAEAVHAKYPDMILIANEWAGSHPTDPVADIIDEHYYNNPDWFIWNANHYDSYDRKGSKIFVGEYAVTSEAGNGNLRGAIGEAAWMTGLERNSDIVSMAAYAPLFCNANHKEWPINLINYDSYRWFGLPSYYVQQLFAENQGTVALPVTVSHGPTIKAPYSNGRIGLGTWNNSAEFKELKVTSPSGKILYQNNFTKNIDDWTKIGQGKWSVENGVLRQSAIAQNVTAFVGDVNWTDYTITLKARKLAGENGFQIYFRNQNAGQRLRWDLGGYNNSVNLLEIGVTSASINATIEPGRWYDLKLVISSSGVKGYLDGVLVQELTDNTSANSSLTASASKDERSGDVILKIVNGHTEAVNTTIKLAGVTSLKGMADLTVLTSDSPLDENTLENPTKVSPKTEPLKLSGKSIKRLFPANSLTIIRIHAKDIN